MNKGRKFAFLIMLLILLPLCVFAHSGDTDWRGGHTDSETGKYHYHHGYLAHNHWDMDGDGDIDCPYLFDDKTGQNSGVSGSGAGSGDSSSTDMYKNGYEKGYNDGYDDGYEDGYKDGHNSGYAQAEADLLEKHQKEVKRSEISAVMLTTIVAAMIGTFAALCLANRRVQKEQERWQKEIARIKQERLNDSNMAVLRRIDPEAKEYVRLPDGVKLDLKCTPIKGYVNAERPYGDFTAYISAAGKRYHYRKGCSGANKKIHVLDRPTELTPCSVCVGRDAYEVTPDWYLQIMGSGRKTADVSTVKEQTVKEATQTSTSSYSEPKSMQSICISRLDYQAGVLYITFSGGGTYAYYNVPREVYDGLLKAQSPGKYFHEKINGVYPYAPYHE